MNYKLQIHFLNDITMWRAHVSALIHMNTIKSPFLHQCRLHSNGNGFKIVQKGFIKSSSNLQEAYHLGFSCQHRTRHNVHSHTGNTRQPEPQLKSSSCSSAIPSHNLRYAISSHNSRNATCLTPILSHN